MNGQTMKRHVRGKLLRATLGVFLLTAAAVIGVVAWKHDASEKERLAEMEAQVTAPYMVADGGDVSRTA